MQKERDLWWWLSPDSCTPGAWPHPHPACGLSGSFPLKSICRSIPFRAQVASASLSVSHHPGSSQAGVIIMPHQDENEAWGLARVSELESDPPPKALSFFHVALGTHKRKNSLVHTCVWLTHSAVPLKRSQHSKSPRLQ